MYIHSGNTTEGQTLQSNNIWDFAFLKQLTQKVFHLFSIRMHIQVLLFGMGMHLDKMGFSNHTPPNIAKAMEIRFHTSIYQHIIQIR